MISPAQQQLDEALTTAGHSDACPAFDGRRCPGPPACEGSPIAEELYAAAGAGLPEPSRVVSEVVELQRDRRATAQHLDGSITLTGPAAAALVEYEAAAKDLKGLTEVYRRAQERFTRANQAFADAMAER